MPPPLILPPSPGPSHSTPIVGLPVFAANRRGGSMLRTKSLAPPPYTSTPAGTGDGVRPGRVLALILNCHSEDRQRHPTPPPLQVGGGGRTRSRPAAQGTPAAGLRRPYITAYSAETQLLNRPNHHHFPPTQQSSIQRHRRIKDTGMDWQKKNVESPLF